MIWACRAKKRPQARNAVVIQFFDEMRNSDGSLKPVVHVECNDYNMEYFLVTVARKVLGIV